MFPCQGKCRRFESDYPLQTRTSIMELQAIESLFPVAVGFYRDSAGIGSKKLKFLENLPQRPNMHNRTSDDNYL